MLAVNLLIVIKCLLTSFLEYVKFIFSSTTMNLRECTECKKNNDITVTEQNFNNKDSIIQVILSE